MKKNVYPMAFALMMLLSSCSVIGGIFKAGVWTGIIIVAILIAVIVWLISRSSGRD
ncbi:phosphatidate cytidylyltransferase [Chitinophaga sp. Cy-1792]|uniref:phosphatidate cytidylyltransferase n=1 Tax=Chitinophaga sp. Cy-1792 TaxID=2608339 RepID=UPI00141EDCEE|nr:phosphatidate cytidylyltransferase [Chitinophaga sp. Cy-1792]NIG54565.1 phosphatidate cytidylyltransferase [Chitinophaga sp. Cy-1792]